MAGLNNKIRTDGLTAPFPKAMPASLTTDEASVSLLAQRRNALLLHLGGERLGTVRVIGQRAEIRRPQFTLNICPNRPTISSSKVVLTGGLVSCSGSRTG